MATNTVLSHYEWENDIPFNVNVVKRTIHAILGESIHVRGLIDENPTKTKWKLNNVNHEMNDTFGNYSLSQVNSNFSIIVSGTDTSSHIKISGDCRSSLYNFPAYLQGECEKFIKVLSYYLEHQSDVDWWYNEQKPKLQSYADEHPTNDNSGCGVCLVIASIVFVLIMLLGK